MAAMWKAGAPTAAKALALLALVINPLTHEAIARIRHVRAPAKLSYFAVILLVPLAFGALAIEGMATFETEARRLGFASAADRQRASDLKLQNAEALAAHDKDRRDRFCRERADRRPLECFEPGHRATALAFARSRFDEAELEPVIKAALADQRTRVLGSSPACRAFLDRIDEDAPEAMMADPARAVGIQAAIWAAMLSERDMKLMIERAKPGTSHVSTPESRAVEARISAASTDAQRLFSEHVQAWSREVVLSGTGWKQILRGPPPMAGCSMGQISAGR